MRVPPSVQRGSYEELYVALASALHLPLALIIHGGCRARARGCDEARRGC